MRRHGLNLLAVSRPTGTLKLLTYESVAWFGLVRPWPHIIDITSPVHFTVSANGRSSAVGIFVIGLSLPSIST